MTHIHIECSGLLERGYKVVQLPIFLTECCLANQLVAYAVGPKRQKSPAGRMPMELHLADSTIQTGFNAISGCWGRKSEVGKTFLHSAHNRDPCS
jgi:hypothetical protein